MDEPQQPPPHAGERLTREDVLRLIEEHGGPEGLDLREANLRQANLGALDLHRTDLHKAHLQGAQFHKADLQGAHLRAADLQGALLWGVNLQEADLLGANLQGATLVHADVQRANLRWANLQGAHLSEASLQGAELIEANIQGADFVGALLQGADLRSADLQEADLLGANLQGANLERADLRRTRLAGASLRDTNLADVNWGDHKLGEEIAGDFADAASAYRALKQRHAESGMYDIAGEFHYREMEARRKLAQKEVRIPDLLALNLFRLLFGYGERPQRVIGWAAVLVFGLALVHWLFGTVAGGFLDALYFSAVSFPALGYGDWSPEPQGWAGRFLGAGESFLGVFMMALFLVTFTRKMTR